MNTNFTFFIYIALTTIFIIKVSFPANTDNLTYENDTCKEIFKKDKLTSTCKIPQVTLAKSC